MECREPRRYPAAPVPRKKPRSPRNEMPDTSPAQEASPAPASPSASAAPAASSAPSSPSDPHDRFFAYTFGQKEHAVGLLRAALPPALVERLDWESLERQPADFIDANLRWRYSDLLFAVRPKDAEEPVLVYVLVEHQSAPHPLMPWRVLRYIVRVGDEHLKAHPEATRLPVIVPIVVYHGKEKWTAPRTLREVLDAPADVLDAASEHLPQLRFRLIDLRHADADALLDRLLSGFGEAALWVMTTGGDDEAVLGGLKKFSDALGDMLAQPGGHEAFGVFLRYILTTHEHIDRGTLRKVVGESVRPEAENDVVTMYEQLVEEGRQEARTAVLFDLLAAKFGGVPERARERVRVAGADELKRWTMNVLTADTLDAVFAAQPAPRPARPTTRKKSSRS